MRIEQIAIKNYRSFRHTVFDDGSLWIPGSCLERVIPPAYLGAVSSFFLPSNLALHNGQYPKSHR